MDINDKLVYCGKRIVNECCHTYYLLSNESVVDKIEREQKYIHLSRLQTFVNLSAITISYKQISSNDLAKKYSKHWHGAR